MRNLKGYEQVMVRAMGKIVFQEGETVMVGCNFKCVGSSRSVPKGAIRSMQPTRKGSHGKSDDRKKDF